MESLKSKSVSFEVSAVIQGEKYPINLGVNEIMELRAIYYYIGSDIAVGINNLFYGLYRKSEKLPALLIGSTDSDIIWSSGWVVDFVTESVKLSKSEYILFPQPILLLRPPQLCGIVGGGDFPNNMMDVRLYYTLKRISKDLMSKLMLKDHE